MKFFFLKIEIFFENHPPTRHIKYKRIDFAPCNRSIITNELLSTNLERFLRRIRTNANQNKAPYELIKKRAKNKGLLNAASNTQLAMKHSKHSATGRCQTKKRNQSHSNSAVNQ